MKNPAHIWTHLSKEESKLLYILSKRRWYAKQNSVKGTEKKNYCYKEHLNWVDKNNKGRSHFGVNPDYLPREDLRFDTFHLKCAITRRLMTCLRNYILRQTEDIINKFNIILKTYCNDYHLYVWNNHKNFASFLGNEIGLFVGNTEEVMLQFSTENLLPMVSPQNMSSIDDIFSH